MRAPQPHLWTLVSVPLVLAACGDFTRAPGSEVGEASEEDGGAFVERARRAYEELAYGDGDPDTTGDLPSHAEQGDTGANGETEGAGGVPSAPGDGEKPINLPETKDTDEPGDDQEEEGGEGGDREGDEGADEPDPEEGGEGREGTEGGEGGEGEEDICLEYENFELDGCMEDCLGGAGTSKEPSPEAVYDCVASCLDPVPAACMSCQETAIKCVVDNACMETGYLALDTACAATKCPDAHKDCEFGPDDLPPSRCLPDENCADTRDGDTLCLPGNFPLGQPSGEANQRGGRCKVRDDGTSGCAYGTVCARGRGRDDGVCAAICDPSLPDATGPPVHEPDAGTVNPPPDAGEPDAGAPDAGAPDAGVIDPVPTVECPGLSQCTAGCNKDQDCIRKCFADVDSLCKECLAGLIQCASGNGCVGKDDAGKTTFDLECFKATCTDDFFVCFEKT